MTISSYTVSVSHLLIVILSREEVFHQSDTVSQLFTQSVQELVSVPAPGGSGEGEQLPASGQGAGGVVRVLGRRRGALQAHVGVGVSAARRGDGSPVVELIQRVGQRFLPCQRQT